jgi:predicted dehydrogenase
MIASRIPPAKEAPAFGWGVLGTGWIADRFVRAVTSRTRQSIVAVGSRDRHRADAFARQHGIPRAHGGYEELVADPAVDIVYVATGHLDHHAHALLAIAAGKHVLVEKPIGIDAAEARSIAGAARRAGVFCAEALWTFFLPRFDVVAQLLASEGFGELRSVIAHYDEWLPESHRAMRPELAGGSLLDLGTYPIALAARLLGPVHELAAFGTNARSGVNAQATMALRSGDVLASLHTGISGTGDSGATLIGAEGSIVLPGPFYQPGPVLWVDHEGKARTVFEEGRIGHDGLFWEAAAVARDVDAGRAESAQRPLDDSIRFLELMDELRRDLGVVFPGEAMRVQRPADDRR